jgi:hypothetical protein
MRDFIYLSYKKNKKIKNNIDHKALRIPKFDKLIFLHYV